MLAKSFDNIALSVASSSMIFLWASYIPRLVERLLFSISVGISIIFLIKQLLKRINHRTTLSREEKTQALNTCTTLQNAPPDKVNKFFLYALKKKFDTKAISPFHFETTMKNNDQAVFSINFFSNTYSKPELIKEYIDYFEYNKIFIIAPSFDKECIETASKITKIVLLDSTRTYKLLQYLNTLPQIKQPKHKRFAFVKLFYNSLTRKNALQYFKISIILLSFCVFLTQNIVYRIFTSITFVLTILCLLKKPTQESPPQLFFE